MRPARSIRFKPSPPLALASHPLSGRLCYFLSVDSGLRLGAISFDAVKHLLLCRLEGRPPRLDLDLYPYLPRVTVKTTSVTDYMALLPGRAA